MTLSSLMMNGCIERNTFQPQPKAQLTMPNKGWNKVALSNREDCPDCYAKPISNIKNAKVAKIKLNRNEVLSYDYSKAPADTFNNTVDYAKAPSASFSNVSVRKKRVAAIDTYSYDAYDYTVTPDDTYVKRDEAINRQVTRQISYVNTSHGNYSNKTAVQIGAFRRYAGAKSYAKKYDLLSGKYHVEIKTGLKDKKPIHRVRIEGFSTRSEAKNFIARYGINDAFLVRR